MARVIFEGLTSAQAEMIAHWFEGQGEQNLYEWASCQDDDVKPPLTDCKDPNWLAVDGDDVIVKCYTPGE